MIMDGCYKCVPHVHSSYADVFVDSQVWDELGGEQSGRIHRRGQKHHLSGPYTSSLSIEFKAPDTVDYLGLLEKFLVERNEHANTEKAKPQIYHSNYSDITSYDANSGFPV